MSLEHSIWRVGARPTRLHETQLPSEFDLEEMICHDPAILSEDWMLIGRQIVTDFGKRVDLLAIDQLGSLIVVELKRDRTPRDVIAQALEYAGWVQRLKSNDVADIFGRFVTGSTSLDEAFRARFSADLDDGSLNSSHQLVVVATRMDPQTERIVRYLSDSSVPINFVSFRVFEDNGVSYLSRAWFIDPDETQQKSQAPRSPDRHQEPWNGETYVSFGPQESRHWDDARKYGFISAGGKGWYSKTLFNLEPGDRIWVNVSGHGYAGVGKVVESAQKMDEFEVDTPEVRVPPLCDHGLLCSRVHNLVA